jgi:hypothetical protein
MDALPASGETMQQKVERIDATPDLLLKHPNTTVTIYIRRQLKHLKHASETLEKTPETHLKTIATIHNIQIKHMQLMCETYAISR